MVWQKTLARPVTFTGIGLHRGRPATMIVFPAAADTGVRFVREDLPNQPQVQALHTCVLDTSRATTLRQGNAVFSTVEHLLAALRGVGVDNALIQVEGPEIPIMDGSAADGPRQRVPSNPFCWKGKPTSPPEIWITRSLPTVKLCA